MTCVICQRDLVVDTQTCDRCHRRVEEQLADIVGLYAQLPAHLTPGATNTEHVSGSREAPLPLRVDVLDLTLPAHTGTAHAAYAADQAGAISVAAILDSWARDWQATRAMGETLPAPTVPELARWLHNRLDWAAKHHPAVDEYATEIQHTWRTLRRVIHPRQPAKTRLGIPCRWCNNLTLWRHDDDRVHCAYPDCGLILTLDDYDRWVALLAAYYQGVHA